MLRGEFVHLLTCGRRSLVSVTQNDIAAGELCKLARVTGPEFSLPLLSSRTLPASVHNKTSRFCGSKAKCTRFLYHVLKIAGQLPTPRAPSPQGRAPATVDHRAPSADGRATATGDHRGTTGDRRAPSPDGRVTAIGDRRAPPPHGRTPSSEESPGDTAGF